ncbi:MAG: periplasmic heavy metal sensor [Blastocatellia bacterium]|nr:periplasmic heavy metal sensor [Blastocatellia bacterium]MBK6427038.1 periplasmic heavy metal sensor [Blastocatellia bacterium]
MDRTSTRSRLIGMTLVVTLLLTLGHGVTLAGQRASRAFEPVRLITGFVDRLNLTPQQRAEIRVVLEAHQADLTSLVEREVAARAVLFQAIHQPETNEQAVRLASRVVASADADLAIERAEIYTEVSPILTEEQKAEVAAFTERMRKLVQSDLERTIGPRAGLNKLNLSEEQRAAIRAIIESHAPTLEALVSQEIATRTALTDAIRQPQVSEDAVREASAAVAAVDVELAVERAEIFAEIEDTLTPDQRAKLASVQERLRQALEDRGELAFTVGMRLLV